MSEADTPPIDESDQSDDSYEDMDEVTTSTKSRWTYTGTVLAIIVILSLPALIIGSAYGILAIASISEYWFGLYALVVTMAATWTFGKGVLESVRKS